MSENPPPFVGLPPTPAVPPPPTASPKKRSPLPRIAAGCLGVIVLGCALVGGFVFYENYQQEQNYNTGHAAYAQGDCVTALGPLQQAASGNPGSADSDVAFKAQAEVQECEALLAAETLSPGDAVVSYSDFMNKYPASPLSTAALSEGQALVSNTAADQLISGNFCQNIDGLLSQQFISNAGEQIPQLLFACGQAYEGAQNYSDALFFYDRFRNEFPEHSLAAEVEAAYVRATLGEADVTGAGSLPAPQAVGGTADAGQVRVVIQNDSTERLQMIFSGPEVRVEELEPCVGCSDFSGSEPTVCPELGPIGEYLLAPGTYDVVVKAIGSDSVTPFRGSWALDGGQEYSSCFYLVTTE